MPGPVPLTGPSLRSPRFLVGKDSHGHWVAQDERGLCGGLFVSRGAAVKFAVREAGPQCIIMASGVVELAFSGTTHRLNQPPSPAQRAA